MPRHDTRQEQAIKSISSMASAEVHDVLYAIACAYSGKTGLLNVPELCHQMADARCFCGCHTGTVVMTSEGAVDLEGAACTKPRCSGT